jgi:adenylate cyclase, class 2
MVYEVERKFSLNDVVGTKSALDQLKVHWHSPIEQCDTYFNHVSRDFGETDEALRLRQVGSKNWITYKGPKIDKTTKTRHEIELPLGEGAKTAEQFDQIFTALGFKRVMQVRKTRTPATINVNQFECEVAWDEVAGLGTFVELEISADDSSLDSAKAALEKLATQLNLTSDERRSYLEMMLEKAK